MKVFNLRRISDGLFSTGGLFPDFDATGKSWKRLGDCKTALHLFLMDVLPYTTQTAQDPDAYEVVEFALVESSKATPLKDFYPEFFD